MASATLDKKIKEPTASAALAGAYAHLKLFGTE
jgi:hypothetical protein